MKQFLITPAGGKRLIAKALTSHPAIQSALESGTVAIIAGTTNGYVAEEVLACIGQVEGFAKNHFFSWDNASSFPTDNQKREAYG